MSWLIGFILFVVIGVWIARERRMSRICKDLNARADDLLSVGNQPLFSTSGQDNPSRLAALMDRIEQEHEHLRRQRQLAEANLQIILSSMQEGVMVVDSRHTVRVVNPSLRKLFHLLGDLFGRPVLEILREPEFEKMITEALDSGRPQEKEVLSHQAGSARILSVNASPIRDAAGEAGVVAMFRDVTRLNQLEDVRREFVANVSHELRTPLAIFQGYVENLIDAPGMEREEQAQTFVILQKHSRRLNALVEDLLILARLEARSDTLHREQLNIGGFLHEFVRDWSVRVKAKQVLMKLELEDELPFISADHMRIEQVLNNLLDNAFKYSPQGGTIEIGAKRCPAGVEFWVKDSGPGILSTDLSHIFERFYRADKARSRELGGTGLGLSIVKHLVQAHGGSVEAQSTLGKGTTIILRFPIEKQGETPNP